MDEDKDVTQFPQPEEKVFTIEGNHKVEPRRPLTRGEKRKLTRRAKGKKKYGY